MIGWWRAQPLDAILRREPRADVPTGGGGGHSGGGEHGGAGGGTSRGPGGFSDLPDLDTHSSALVLLSKLELPPPAVEVRLRACVLCVAWCVLRF